MFVRALGETRPSIEGNDTPLGKAFESATPRGGSGHRRARSDGDGLGLSAKPRRMSRSPFKQAPKRFEPINQQNASVDEMQENINPFVKRGLRRSPVGQNSSQQGVLQDLQEQSINPFEKRGLRRSPVSSQAVEAVGELLSPTSASPEVSTTPTQPVILRAADTLPPNDPPHPPDEDNYTTQSTEPITLNSFETRFPLNNIERPKVSADLETLPDQEPQPDKRARSLSRRRSRFSKAPEPIVEPQVDRRSRSTSRRRGRSPGLAEPVAQQPQVHGRSRSTSRRRGQSSEAVAPVIQPQQQTNPDSWSESRRPVRSSQAAEPIFFGTSRRREEPNLPPTPTQRGIPDPVVTTPPAGIHDTPSKRARKKVEKHKSSPLKPRDPPPLKPAKAIELDPQRKPEEPVKRRRSVRFLVPEDPHAAKTKERDDLLKELQQLQADVALANQENERLRLRYDSKKSVPTAPSNPDELLDLLLRSTVPEPVSESKPKSTSVFKSIRSFLPFHPRRKRQTTSLAALEKPVPSHLPIAVDDPMPYLQVFSPLIYTSSITLLPPETTSPDTSMQEAEQPILQRHQIKASHPSGLFSARLSMVVDSSLLSIASLDIEKLPTSAEKELGTFMRARSDPEVVLNRDIGAICWAMGRWVEVSVERARFWCAVELKFATPEARAKSLATNKQRKKRKRRQMIDEDDVSSHDRNDEDEEMRNQKWTIKQLLPQMGRTALELSNDEVELRFEWKIGFDWTGEVESSVSASARLPQSCKNAPITLFRWVGSC